MRAPYPVLDVTQRADLPRGCCAVAVMAKTPRTGAVKTRLVPPLELNEAALLNACFLRDVTECIAALASPTVHGYVAYTPVGGELAFDGLLPDGFRLLPQRGADLGERLLHVTEDFLDAGYDAVCLVNSDSPTLPCELLRRAIEALAPTGDRIVLGKAVDGGYYIIGAKRAHPRLFEDIPWSSPAVFDQTMQRARELGIDVQLLPAWYDVDDLESLRWLCEELFAGKTSQNTEGLIANHALHTRKYLYSLLAKRGLPSLGLEWPALGAP